MTFAFVLWHPGRREFVAPSGSEHSYTRSIHRARLFRTREEAEAERCVDSEVVRSVSDFKSWEIRL
jgi:hypothetical protein